MEIIVQRTDTDGGLELICPCCRTANAVEERDAASRVNELTDATLDDQGGLQLHFGCGDYQWDHDTYRCRACHAEDLEFPEDLTVITGYA